MIACWFKWDRDGDSAWMGFAMAENKTELFWEIDQYGDPYTCEVISERRSGSHCSLVQVDEEDGWRVVVERSELEVAEREPLVDDDRWRSPNWPKDVFPVRP